MSGCGCSRRCTCTVIAGPGTEVDGNGSTSNPYVISATGAVAATGCGLTGSGATASPLAANTSTWPYPCDIAANSSGIYCDPDTGELRGEPRGKATLLTRGESREYDLRVPAGATADVLVDTFQFDFTNPDACREAYVFQVIESDVWFDLPAGSSAASGVTGDELQHVYNTGTTDAVNWHVQHMKFLSANGGNTVPAGGTYTAGMSVFYGQGTGGARLVHVQSIIRTLWLSI